MRKIEKRQSFFFILFNAHSNLFKKTIKQNTFIVSIHLFISFLYIHIHLPMSPFEFKLYKNKLVYSYKSTFNLYKYFIILM